MLSCAREMRAPVTFQAKVTGDVTVRMARSFVAGSGATGPGDDPGIAGGVG